MKKLISNQISPNLKFKDFLIGCKSFLCVRRELKFEQFFCTKNYFLCNAARTGLTKIIDLLDLPQEKKIVGIPAFCCGVMATPFLTKGFKIQWLDTKNDGNFDFEFFKTQAPKISVLLVPHVFGQKNNTKEIFEYCEKNNIFFIEDTAHSFNPLEKEDAEYFHAKICSFGREKTFSCVSGGAVIWPQNSPHHEKFIAIKHSLPKAKISWTLQHLSQIFIFSMALPWWFQGGKLIPYAAQKLKILPFAVTPKEKDGVEDFPQTALPYPLQKILFTQLSHAKEIQNHREKISQKWQQYLSKTFPDFPIIIPENHFRVILHCPDKSKKEEIFSQFKTKGLLLQEWDGNPIAPKSVNLEKFKYQKNACPNAEKFSQTYLSFPTNTRVNSKLWVFKKY